MWTRTTPEGRLHTLLLRCSKQAQCQHPACNGTGLKVTTPLVNAGERVNAVPKRIASVWKFGWMLKAPAGQEAAYKALAARRDAAAGIQATTSVQGDAQGQGAGTGEAAAAKK